MGQALCPWWLLLWEAGGAHLCRVDRCDPGLYPTWDGFPGSSPGKGGSEAIQGCCWGGLWIQWSRASEGFLLAMLVALFLQVLLQLEFVSLAFVPWNASC